MSDGRGEGEDRLRWKHGRLGTEGGRVKTDRSHESFVAAYREVRIDGCEWAPTATGSHAPFRSGKEGEEGRYWWNEKAMEELTVHQSHQLAWARAHHHVYDYFADPARFLVTPPKCTGH